MLPRPVLDCQHVAPFLNSSTSMVTDVEQRGQILHFLIPTKITEGMGEMSK